MKIYWRVNYVSNHMKMVKIAALCFSEPQTARKTLEHNFKRATGERALILLVFIVLSRTWLYKVEKRNLFQQIYCVIVCRYELKWCSMLMQINCKTSTTSSSWRYKTGIHCQHKTFRRVGSITAVPRLQYFLKYHVKSGHSLGFRKQLIGLLFFNIIWSR